MKLLLTAFDPFGGADINPALEAVKLVPDRIGDVEIVKLEVPTVFRKSVELVTAKMTELKPDAVLCVGQAGGRYDLTPERVAINLDDARIPDNEGNQPIDTPIFADGAPAYFATLPIKAMAAKIREAGLPASVSNTARSRGSREATRSVRPAAAAGSSPSRRHPPGSTLMASRTSSTGSSP